MGLAEVTKDVEKLYGAVVTDGQWVVDTKKQVFSLGPSLDFITHGGVQEGSWMGISGPEKTCKTATALSLAAQMQAAGRHVVYGDVELRVTPQHLLGTRGLKLDSASFSRVASSKAKILSAQDHLKTYLRYLKEIPGCCLIIDSISALVDERELEGGIGTETRGSGAKLFAQFVSLAANVVPVNDCVVVGIVQQYSNTSGYGAHKLDKVASRFKYQEDYILKVKKCESWEASGNLLGAKITWECRNTKFGPPGGVFTSHVRYGVGVDHAYELIVLGEAFNVISLKGGWYTFQGKKYQGGEKLYRALSESPELFEELKLELARARP